MTTVSDHRTEDDIPAEWSAIVASIPQPEWATERDVDWRRNKAGELWDVSFIDSAEIETDDPDVSITLDYFHSIPSLEAGVLPSTPSANIVWDYAEIHTGRRFAERLEIPNVAHIPRLVAALLTAYTTAHGPLTAEQTDGFGLFSLPLASRMTMHDLFVLSTALGVNASDVLTAVTSEVTA